MQIVVPVKQYGLAKQRLTARLSRAQRISIMRAMAERVLQELSVTPGLQVVSVVSAEPEVRLLAARHGFAFVAEPEGCDLNAALALASRQLDGTKDIGIVHADLPLFNAREFARVMAVHRQGAARQLTIVVDARAEGTNVRLCRPGTAVALRYGPNSARRHREEAARAGLAVSAGESADLSLDLDRPEDIDAIIAHAGSSAAASDPVLGLLLAWSRSLSERTIA